MSAGEAPSGLLSRLAQWLRQRRHRTDAGFGDAEAQAGPSPQALKEAIERKRRNERVREHEFDHLRQLRNRGIGVGRQASGSQLSLFEDTLSAGPGERAQTLRKIDRVEAQMARAKWRGAPAPPTPAVPLSDTTLPPAERTGDDLHLAGFAPTMMPAAPEATVAKDGHATPAAAPWRPAALPQADVARAQADIDPELERAALRLALGDMADTGAVSAAPASDEPALAGQLCGDIDAVLAALTAGRGGVPVLAVSCARLARVDFAAAGCLLDWAQALQARGCQVQLRDVSPLVATFLRVVGLTEHAQVAPRTP